MKTQTPSVPDRQMGRPVRILLMALPGAIRKAIPAGIALLLAGCPISTTSASLSKEDGADGAPSAPAQQTASASAASTSTGTSPEGLAAKADRLQTPATPAAAAKSSASEQEAVRQALLNEPSLKTELQQALADYNTPDRTLVPLSVGAIAIVENYALAKAEGGYEDLPIINGYYLLRKQNGQWTIMDKIGHGSSIETGQLTLLGLSNEVISSLLDALQTADADLIVSDTPVISREQVVLGGISVDMTVAQVKQRLGQPLSERVEDTGCCGPLIYLEYPNFSLGLSEDGVFQMTATHRDVATGAGVRVGDTHEAVTNAYGSPSVASGEMLTYYVSGAYESEWFSFALENGRVVEITYETLLN
ncbi:hypothetical protein [Thermoleptolyngbya sp. C42_A2020_037]|uniref:hypothetical protein n=1 Tax=Thermoleptolyngbya sp. C42_A2020_037 TaxID=2747799 RepID=UPI001A01E389|nr:hypothetical protein [Thermoleptolyngbya sp. C42_A2020_037]MBF2084760.1 hypothetical protein [Thermoleptolyngbya sp. C42_A2020_037]